MFALVVYKWIQYLANIKSLPMIETMNITQWSNTGQNRDLIGYIGPCKRSTNGVLVPFCHATIRSWQPRPQAAFMDGVALRDRELERNGTRSWSIFENGLNFAEVSELYIFNKLFCLRDQPVSYSVLIVEMMIRQSIFGFCRVCRAPT